MASPQTRAGARLGTSLAGGIVGAIVGGVIGGLTAGTGAQIGFLVGSLLGALLFPVGNAPKPPTDALKTLNSAYGLTIPRGYGTIRLPGNVIWASQAALRRPVESNADQPKEREQLKHHANFAVSFGVGPAVDVLRIWANGDLIMDRRPVAEGEVTKETIQLRDLVFRFYPGTETQEPDFLIERDVGVGQTPAYRGQVYIVFDQFPLAKYGSIPNITAEVAFETESADPSEFVQEGTAITGGDLFEAANTFLAVDWDRRFAYVIDTTPVEVPPNTTSTGIRRFDLRSMQEDRQATSANALNQTFRSDGDAAFRGPACVLFNGGILTQIETQAGTNAEPWVVLSPESLKERARFGLPGSTLGYSYSAYGLSRSAAPIGGVLSQSFGIPEDWAVVRRDNDSIGLLVYSPFIETVFQLIDAILMSVIGAGGLNQVWNSDEDLTDFTGSIRSVVGAAFPPILEDFDSQFYALRGNDYLFPSGDDLILHRIDVTSFAPTLSVLRSFFGTTASSAAAGGTLAKTLPIVGLIQGIRKAVSRGVGRGKVAFTPDDIIPGETALRAPTGRDMVYDTVDDTVIVPVRADSDGQDYWVKIDLNAPSGQEVVWRVAVPFLPTDGTAIGQSRLENGTFGYVVDDDGILLDTVNGTIIATRTYSVAARANAPGAYDSQSESWIGMTDSTDTVLAKWYFRRIKPGKATVADIITDIASIVDLEPADLDVSELLTDEIEGYVLNGQIDAKTGMLPMAQVFFFDGVESDHKLKFPKRGAPLVRTISQDDLIQDGPSTLPLVETRTQDVELPRRLTVTYLDPALDYTTGTQTVKRVLVPDAAVFSDQSVDIELPMVANADFVRQAGEKALYDFWIGRRSYTTKMSWAHLDLDPSDPIAVETDEIDADRVRVLTVDAGADLTLELRAAQEIDGQYISDVVGDSGSGLVPNEIPGTGPTRLFVFDIPLLRDRDDIPQSTLIRHYVAMAGFGQFWAGGTAYEFADDGFERLLDVAEEIIWGSALTTLGDPPDGNPFVTDEANELTVRFVNGAAPQVASVTQLEMLNGANFALLRNSDGEAEFIHFRDVTDNGDGTFTLGGFLRGRRGTDVNAFGHESGEEFILLRPTTDVYAFQLALERLGELVPYRGVEAGSVFYRGATAVLESTGASLKPYEPALHEATLEAGDDIQLTWVRRTRVGGDIFLEDLGGIVPIAEESEEYELEILDSPGGTIVRTVTGLTDPEYLYTSAQQSTDGFSPPLTSITVRVFQISAQVGRGFAREHTIEVE